MLSQSLRAPFLVALIILLTLLVSVDVRAIELSPGDILVGALDGGGAVVYRIDAVTGERTVISNAEVGTGPIQHEAYVAIDSAGQIFTSGSIGSWPFEGTIFRIDPATGNRTLVSGATRGDGSPFGMQVFYVQPLPDGSLIALADSLYNSFFRVDSASGDRAFLPIEAFSTPPQFGIPAGFSVAPNGDVWMASFSYPQNIGVFWLNPDTGAHGVVSSSQANPDTGIDIVGSGPVLTDTMHGQSFGQDGNFYVIQSTNVLRIDPLTGNRELVSSWDPANLLGTGLALKEPYGLAAELDGSLLTLSDSKLIRIDSLTGNRTILSDFPAEFTFPLSVAVVPKTVPEPSTIALAGLGAISLFAPQLRRCRTSN